MYDDFSEDYDRFVDWDGRLKFEMPWLVSQLREAGAQRVLDSACGTGVHVIALKAAGFTPAGADLSEGMIASARKNAEEAGAQARFEQAGFGKMHAAFGEESCDALLCLGNSLPHASTNAALVETLADFNACLRPGGLLIIQNRNFEAVMAQRQRWMEPQSAREGDTDWLFLRFYDFEGDDSIRFNIISLKREAGGEWKQSILSTPLRPILRQELHTLLGVAGFDDLRYYGDMSGSAFDEEKSGNLVVTARKR